MSIAFDVAVVVIVVLFACLGYWRGFVRTALGLVGYAVAATLSYILSLPIANWIYQTFMRGASIELILGGLGKLSKDTSLQTALDEAVSILPQGVHSLLPEGAIEGVKMQLLQSVPTHQEIATTLTDQLVEPVATTILQLFSILLLFVILCVVVRILTKMTKWIDKIPLIGRLNASLGVMAGLVEAVVVLALFTGVVALLIFLSGNQWELVNRSMIEETYLFKFLYESNPLIAFK